MEARRLSCPLSLLSASRNQLYGLDHSHLNQEEELTVFLAFFDLLCHYLFRTHNLGHPAYCLWLSTTFSLPVLASEIFAAERLTLSDVIFRSVIVKGKDLCMRFYLHL